MYSTIVVTASAVRLTKDPVLREVNGYVLADTAIAATEISKNGQKRTTYIDITVFGKLATYLANNATKGTIISILSGKLKSNEWVDETTNKKKQKHSLLVNGLVILAQPGHMNYGQNRLPSRTK